MTHAPELPADVPDGWTTTVPGSHDLPELVALLAAHQRVANGSSSVDEDSVATNVVGPGSWTRRQVVVRDGAGDLAAWATVYDRASGRTVVEVTVRPDRGDDEVVDTLAASLFSWAYGQACEVARTRGIRQTQLDSGAYSRDERQRRWLANAGYDRTRTWWQMSRPVTAADHGLPGPREGVTVRPVARHDDGLPVAADLQTVHQVLEESFADHFNSYRESFPEFVQRLREDPGHRWDHWWLAEVELDGEVLPGGALVGSVLPPEASGVAGSYIDYIGVHRRSRGRGVAKALLHTVIRDALERGRNRVGLEVDADSPTGAEGLYTSMGWVTSYTTESWHRDVDFDSDVQ
ncbi:GNAT family N-acetyltransferase [Rudaeicoccus suwonensis]|uniref:Ribosomal protein S18 acetylase RimI-like enzyme n=1 Tax=Rudaeicoccus suwonensis TaxID=657409 RepID=A0A561E2V7_9MICO|nr:GNAT family N-acetyltransferase [Rudaeicoccus suwonensis]TWE09946.1 ribosomal protein S18 acetylase RimI-like enzyme [Rudaeicoccus suwonensis]